MAEYVKVGPWVNGGAPALSAANLDTLETQYELIKSEDLTFAGIKSFSGTVLVAQDIQHIGDTNTKIEFTPDAISLETGGTSRVDLSNTGLRIGGAGSRVTGILDEDAMGSDSAVKLATQQSIKAYVDASFKSKLGNSSYNGAGGNQAIAGVGFQPKAVIIFASASTYNEAWSVGFGDENLAEYNLHQSGAATSTLLGANIVECYNAPGNLGWDAVLLSLDADGFTLTWTKNGLPAGTCVYTYLCLK